MRAAPTTTAIALLLSACNGGGGGGGAGETTGVSGATDWSSDEGGTASAEPTGGSVGESGGESSSETGDPPEDCDVGSECLSWCDPLTWAGAVPDASTDVVIAADMIVLVDCDAEAGSITIEPEGELRGSREQTATLTVHGNLVVQGVLDYGRPDERIPANTTAEIVFADVDDDAMVGSPSTVFGGEEHEPSADTEVTVVESDIGLWVEGQGVFRAAGAETKAWSFLVEGAGPGDMTFEVEDATGWRIGDTVVLTPTATRAEDDHVEQFDVGTISTLDGNVVTLDAPPSYTHAGCTDCIRRGEVANLSRSVIVRSADDEGHAHILIKDSGRAELDSVELRWLGPEYSEPVCGAPDRRHALHFHQQDQQSAGSFVRHVAIHGGQHGFVSIERSDGIEVVDVAGYDTYGHGFRLWFDTSACGTRCTDRDSSPADVVWNQVLAARVGAVRRAEGCARISHRLSGVVVSGDENSGCQDCVATGVGIESNGSDVSGYQWAEGGSGRPENFVFDGNIAHNNNGHGAFVWHNSTPFGTAFTRSQFWSNDNHGVLHGAYGNSYVWRDLVVIDNGEAGVGLKAVPGDNAVKIDGGTVDGVHVLPYVLVQEFPQILSDLEFSGDRSPAVTQFTNDCDGNPDDPMDPECSMVLLRFNNPVFPAGTVPFWFGDAVNNHTVWEIRGFEHPDYANLPADFDLYRRDSNVAGGSLEPDFDAWLVPR